MLRRSIPTPAILALVYLSWILIGTALLWLPISSVDSLSFNQAFFTSTSAITVTGLSVINIGAELTLFGQIILALLIHLGGMGLMTFAIVILSSFGMPVTLSQRRILRDEMGLTTLSGLVDLVWAVFKIVILCELVGAVLMSFIFVPEFGWSKGLWNALFHSVSAFNNAGFSLFSDSFMGYHDNPLILLTAATQFMIGGIGFIVLTDIAVVKKWRNFSLHTRIMITGTIILLVSSVLIIGLLEWTNPNTVGALPNTAQKIYAVMFEAATPRTAGFNSLDTSALRDSTALFMMILMVIGGGSMSTAGGIKVTTAAFLLLATIAFFRNTGRVRAFGYSIGLDQGLKVMALTTISLFIILLGLFVIIATHDFDFLDAAFEVVSAFGTVGLSRGITGELNLIGELVICVIMFLGRIGPLTLGVFMMSKTPPLTKFPEGKIFLG